MGHMKTGGSASGAVSWPAPTPHSFAPGPQSSFEDSMPTHCYLDGTDDRGALARGWT